MPGTSLIFNCWLYYCCKLDIHISCPIVCKSDLLKLIDFQAKCTPISCILILNQPPYSTKPLPKPMLTYHEQSEIYGAYTCRQYHKQMWRNQSLKQDWNCMFNSLWPSDAIWRHRSGSTLAQVMAGCLTAPSHYLNQCWLIINLSSDIHVWAISQEMPQSSITKTCFKYY